MAETVTLAPPGGGQQSLAMGQHYLLPEALAAELIAADKAIDPEAPPSCETCGAEAESRALLARHVAANHQAPTPVPAVPSPAALGMVQCPHCPGGVWAENETLLARHVAAHHPKAEA